MEIVLAAHAPLPKAPSAGGGSWQAAWISILLHIAALATICALFLPRRLPDPLPQAGYAVIMAQPPEPAAEQNLQASPLKSTPSVVVTSLAVPRPLSLALPFRAQAQATDLPPRGRPVPRAQTTQSQTSPGRVSTAPPAEPAPAPMEKLPFGLEARIRQAVQDAAIYPASARLMHLQGRTQIRFYYTDGTAATLGVAVSSTSPILDRAAIGAVRNAALPRAPASIGDRKLPVLVWVDFRLVQQD